MKSIRPYHKMFSKNRSINCFLISTSGSDFVAIFAMMKICIISVFVAIGTASDFDPTVHKNWNLLPHGSCGQVSSSRIIGGVEAPMNAYPWIARIGYSSPQATDFSFRCSGVVVNSKTLVTAAHCVSNLPNNTKVEIIRLGEHNISTNPDCKDNFCADPVLDMKPSEILVPKHYNKPPFKHDIALIRLKEDIKFSAFVRPICFTSGDLLKKDYIGSIAEVAGWGIYDIGDPKNSISLQVVKLPIIKNEDCEKYLPTYANIGPTQMCVGGIIGKDSCGGDSGGPLMKVDEATDGPRYFLLGIVSFGSRKCGMSNMPGIYTKMSSYMKWFLDNLIGKPSN